MEENIFLGPAVDILQARILAVALLSTDALNEAERERAMNQWERVTFRIFGLFGKDSRTKVGDYVRLAEKVSNRATGASRYSEIMASLRDLGREYPVDRAVEEGLVGRPIYDDSAAEVIRYILWRYEEQLARRAGRAATVDQQARQEIWRLSALDTIEHVFPQAPEPGGAWDGKMHRVDQAAEPVQNHVHRIGNLLLLPGELNEEAKRRGFAEKKQIYERHNLRSVSEVIALGDWTLTEIEDREERIVAWAKNEWDDLRAE